LRVRENKYGQEVDREVIRESTAGLKQAEHVDKQRGRGLKERRRGEFSNTEIPERVTGQWLGLRRGFLSRKDSRERKTQKESRSAKKRREKIARKLLGPRSGLSGDFYISMSESRYMKMYSITQ
jgi:hypothetical protein